MTTNQSVDDQVAKLNDEFINISNDFGILWPNQDREKLKEFKNTYLDPFYERISEIPENIAVKQDWIQTLNVYKNMIEALENQPEPSPLHRLRYGS